MPRFEGPKKYPGGTSPGAHVRALWMLLSTLIDEAQPYNRARLRTTRAMLERAYPELMPTESDIAQWLAEEDGDAVSEGP